MRYSNEQWVKQLLKNENRLRQRLSLYLLTDNESNCEMDSNAGQRVSVSKSGRETENKIVNKITNKGYEYRRRCLDCVSRLYEEMTPIEEDIIRLKFKHGYTSERVGYEVGYSKSSVDSYIKKQKDKLLSMIKVVEREVYSDNEEVV